MRLPLLLACLLLTGCAAQHERAVSAEDSTEPRELPPDLRTRKTGHDWPCFLGPTADSVSKEKGILTKWPKAGPELVWSKIVGIGYSGPVISCGRLFVFDRVRNKQRLRALKSETGEELWSFEYPTNYRD